MESDSVMYTYSKYRGKRKLPVKPNWGSRQLWLWTADRWHRLMDSVADGVTGVVDDSGEYCWTDCRHCGDYSGSCWVGERRSGGVWNWSWDSGGVSWSRVGNDCGEWLSGSRGLYKRTTAATVMTVCGDRYSVRGYTVTVSVSDVVGAQYVTIGVDVAEASDFVSVGILL